MNVQYTVHSTLFARLITRYFHQHVQGYHQVDDLRPSIYSSSKDSNVIASSRFSPHTAGSALNRSQTAGRSG